jgi:uncharacterized membrane protein HdeD (DUF308 family)
MDADVVLKPIAKIGGVVRLLGIGLVILGALAIWAPQVSGMTVSVVVGVLLWRQWPVSGELAIGVLIGIKLILDGVELIGVGATAKSLAD